MTAKTDDWTQKQHSSATKKQISGLALRLIFDRFSPVNCCFSVVLQLGKGDYPENSRVVFCPSKQRSAEPFMCLDKNEGSTLS